MHDFDNNTKLDGLEILKALTHLLPYEEDEQNKVDVRGKSADDVAREKREKELLYYAGIIEWRTSLRGILGYTGADPESLVGERRVMGCGGTSTVTPCNLPRKNRGGPSLSPVPENNGNYHLKWRILVKRLSE